MLRPADWMIPCPILDSPYYPRVRLSTSANRMPARFSRSRTKGTCCSRYKIFKMTTFSSSPSAWKRPEGCSPRGCRWRRDSALPSFLAGTDSLPVPLHVLAHERRTPLAVVHWPRGRGRVDEHGQESSDRHVQRDREVPVGEVDPSALPYRAAEDRPQPRFRLGAGQGLGRHWDRWLPKDCAHSSSLLSVGCRAARATTISCG